MKSRAAVCAIAIAAMGLGSSTYAQSHRSNDHRLHAPRRGQQWVQVGADYALIAIATGVIVHLVLSH